MYILEKKKLYVINTFNELILNIILFTFYLNLKMILIFLLILFVYIIKTILKHNNHDGNT
jgi:hypothetical protein